MTPSDARATWRAAAGRRAEHTGSPSRPAAQALVDAFASILYPRRIAGFADSPAGETAFITAQLTGALDQLQAQTAVELAYWQLETAAAFEPDQAATTATLFGRALADVRRLIDSDVDAAFSVIQRRAAPTRS